MVTKQTSKDYTKILNNFTLRKQPDKQYCLLGIIFFINKSFRVFFTAVFFTSPCLSAYGKLSVRTASLFEGLK